MGFITAEAIETVQNDKGTSGYFKLTAVEENAKEGYKVRLLGDSITGVVGWKEIDGNRKPIRFPERPDTPVAELGLAVNKFDGSAGKLTRFVTSVIWDYKTESLQIWEITQQSIIEKLIKMHTDDENWGDITTYDILLYKTKKNDRIEYDVAGAPKSVGKGVPDHIAEAYIAAKIYLEALWNNDDPFAFGKTN